MKSTILFIFIIFIIGVIIISSCTNNNFDPDKFSDEELNIECHSHPWSNDCKIIKNIENIKLCNKCKLSYPEENINNKRKENIVEEVIINKIVVEKPKVYSDKIVNNEKIILKNNDVLKIKDKNYIQKNSIILRDNSKLIIEDSLFEHLHDYSSQYSIESYDNSIIIINNSKIVSSKWLNWNFFNQASLIMDNVDEKESNIWHSFQGKSKADIRNSIFRGTISNEVSFSIENSPETFIETVYPIGAVVDEYLPVKIKDNYIFPNANDKNILFKLNIINSDKAIWGITVNPNNKITIRNANPLVVTFNIGSPWKYITAEFDGINEGFYANRKFVVEDSYLYLINVTTWPWSPIVSNDNTLIIKNSKIADNAFSSGNAKIIIENSTASFLKANDNVEMTIKNSIVDGDVIASGNSKINLINSIVKGKTIKENAGVII